MNKKFFSNSADNITSLIKNKITKDFTSPTLSIKSENISNQNKFEGGVKNYCHEESVIFFLSKKS